MRCDRRCSGIPAVGEGDALLVWGVAEGNGAQIVCIAVGHRPGQGPVVVAEILLPKSYVTGQRRAAAVDGAAQDDAGYQVRAAAGEVVVRELLTDGGVGAVHVDAADRGHLVRGVVRVRDEITLGIRHAFYFAAKAGGDVHGTNSAVRSEEHTSELQSLTNL